MAQNEANRIAELKIENAKRAGANGLDLSARFDKSTPKLTELPESLAELTELRSLNLSRNELTMLPEWLGQLTQLQSLYLSHNQLAMLPEWLGQLTQLQSLNLSHNQLAILPEWLGQLTELRSLHLSSDQLTALPYSFTELTQLETLDLSYNDLATTPEWLCHFNRLESLDLSQNQHLIIPQCFKQLTQLRTLDLSFTGLTEWPEWLSQLTQLQDLILSGNKLTLIPESVGQLTKLQQLRLQGMRLTALPDSLVRLTQLRQLWLGWRGGEVESSLGYLSGVIRQIKTLETLGISNCQLQELPTWLDELPHLETIFCDDNLLVDLPPSLAECAKLDSLQLNDNPLTPELAAAYEKGLNALKRYLRELAKGAKKRYEAKLLILGDGNEGKTCVSRAIRGLPFQPQVTTRGVDVEQWKFEHPDHAAQSDKEITLNIWDFEGQEINHQTHQFFLSTQALYLLVFKCRDQFLLDRAEYWLDTIRARAPRAKVAIVITQSEERTPYVPQDKLQAQYGDLLASDKWLFAVGCKDDSGIRELQDFLRRSAADLEFMGREWPESYGRAEQAIKEAAKNARSHITRGQLYEIFRGCRINENIFKDLSGSMSTLGVMTQFSDCPDLSDFIVLQPQWLTKAISEVMEDKQLASDKGEIALQRMEDIWEAKAYSGLFATFHDCMKEFELCYDLEDASRSCLLPLRFGYERPQIPWSSGEGFKERRVEYRLNIRPPMGLMSRFIVKTHHMMVNTAEHPKGVYWHNGVFLRAGDGPLTSEALCEFDGHSGKLRVQVRAAFPQNLLEQIHGYVKAVFSFFTGLDAERSYGCIKIDERTDHEEKCTGVHTERRIYSVIRKQRPLDCEYEFHDVDPQKLIFGFSTFGEYVMAKVVTIPELRNELDKKPEWAETLTHDIVKLLGWVEENRGRMTQLIEDQTRLLPEIKQELELKLHEYLAYSSEMLDGREYTAAPGIISISAKDQGQWSTASYFRSTYVLTPFCESICNIHPCEDARVGFTRDREWWEKTVPWIARSSKLLIAGLQLAFAGMPLALGAKAFDSIKDHVKFMSELTKHMELIAEDNETIGSGELFQGDIAKDLRGSERESRLMRVALARFLEETAPNNYQAGQWGSLRRTRMSDNAYRWLCETCTNAVKS
jgi:Leucine-rich repeat (LRR) protein